MDRIDPVGRRTPPWTAPLDVDADRDAIERRRRDAERRRRERKGEERRPPQDGDEPPHLVDVRA